MRPAQHLLLITLAAAVPTASGMAGEIEISDARVPATERAGLDVPLLMRLTNHAAQPDALLRVRCPFANFAEPRTVDFGEGAPADRAIRSIPLPSGADLTLTTRSFHVMLLQTRDALTDGQVMKCSAAFRNAGAQEIEVRVTASP